MDPVAQANMPRAANGLHYGQGVYFSSSCRMGLSYAGKHGPEGTLLLSKVLVGKSRVLRQKDPGCHQLPNCDSHASDADETVGGLRLV